MAATGSSIRCPYQLTELRRHRPYELQEVDGYVWHKKSVLGNGPFSTVYKGWSKTTYEEVAVKLVGKEAFAKAPNGAKSILRETEKQRTLQDCGNILRLCHEECIQDGCVLITELCDKNLTKYIRESNGLGEAAAKDFLQQMAAGLKAMHEKGIVHKDLKPESILLKRDPTTKKMIVKLADFGFEQPNLIETRRAKMTKTITAGTPLFMAPEALESFMNPGIRAKYDEKVDLWSVGALLYNCLAGFPGFFFTDPKFKSLLKTLKGKPDTAIAFRSTGRDVTYVHDLPPDVISRLSRPFKTKMEELLRKLLVVDPRKRMNYGEFLTFVHQLTGTSVTVLPLQSTVRNRRASTTSVDTDGYLGRYPGKNDNPTLRANVEFYKNRKKSEPSGDFIDEIHRTWWSNYDLLRQHAGYHQWLFPIREVGTNKYAQELQLHEADAICKDKVAHARVLKSYEMMLDCYGMKLKDPQTGEIVRAENWSLGYASLNRFVPEHLRITRMLKSLGELAYEHLKAPFVRFCIHEAFETGALGNVGKSCKEYWLYVIRDEAQRHELEDEVARFCT